jgi:hypothetical protein
MRIATCREVANQKRDYGTDYDTAIYARAQYADTPQALSEALPTRVFRTLCLAFAFGYVLALLPLCH